MTLRNVPKAHTLEQQRQEINLIATDLNTAIDGVQTFGGDKEFTGDITFSSSGGASFGDSSDLKIYYDGSVGVETSFIDSDALQIRSATDTSELYATFLKDGPVELYYDGTKTFGTSATGASVIGSLDISGKIIASSNGNIAMGDSPSLNPKIFLGVDGSATFENTVIADGGNSSNDRFVVRTLNDEKFTVIGDGTVDIGGTPGTSPNIHLDADGSATLTGILESSLLVNTNNTPTAGEGIEMFYDSAASGGAAGAIQAFDRDNSALTRLKIRSSNWEILNDGSGSFGGNVSSGTPSEDGTTAGSRLGSNGKIVAARSGSGNQIFEGYLIGDSSPNAVITNDGSATFAGTVAHDFNSNFQKGIRLMDNGGHSMLDVNGTGANATAIAIYDGSTSAYKLNIKHDGSATFAGPVALAGEIKVEGSSTPSGLSSRISKYGSLLIGTSSDAVGDARLSIDSGNGNIISIGSATFSNTVKAQQTSNNALSAFEAVDTNGTRFKVTGAGVLSIYDNTLTEKLTISSDGLTFSGQPNSSVANVTETSSSFDHYEQGTFTPYYGFGLSSASYTFAGGDYIRIGNIVHFYLTISATGTNNTDQVTILGLPYNIAGNDGGSATFAYNTGLVSSNGNMPNVYIAQSNGGISFYETGSGSAWAGNSGSGLSGAQLYIGGHYICA